ncbi:MAG: PKD domain-containing protein [Thermoplasmatota archaeon]
MKVDFILMKFNLGKREIVIFLAIILVVSVGSYLLFIRDSGGGSVDDTDDRDDKNRKPVANAGLDQMVYPGEPAILNASSSSDPDGDDLYFKWDVDAGVDENNDGIKDNDWEINGMVVEWTYPEPTEDISYIVTVNVSDGEAWSTDTSVVTVYVSKNKTIPEVTLSCNYQQQLPYLSSHFIVRVEEVTSEESMMNYSYELENPEGSVIRNGTLSSLIPTGPNSTEIAFIDTPSLGLLDSMDSVSLKENDEIVEGCTFKLYYLMEPEPVGEIELTK